MSPIKDWHLARMIGGVEAHMAGMCPKTRAMRPTATGQQKQTPSA